MGLVTIYEILNGSTLLQANTYQEMLDICTQYNLSPSAIRDKFVEEISQETPYLRISDYAPSADPLFTIAYNPMSAAELERIDYDLKGYHKKRTFLYGELRVVEYYKNYDFFNNIYSDLVIREERKYIRDTNTGLCYARQMNIHWYLNNDTIGNSILNRIKYYSFAESMQELNERRNNLFSDAESLMLYMLSQYFTPVETMTKAVQLKQAIKKQKDLYIDGVAEDIIALISAENNIIDTVFVDGTLAAAIKQQLLGILSYNFTAQVE